MTELLMFPLTLLMSIIGSVVCTILLLFIIAYLFNKLEGE